MMSGKNKDFAIDDYAFYALADLERLCQLESDEIIRDATLDPPMIKLCIHVPKDFRVYSVDTSSINQGLKERIKGQLKSGYIKPNEEEGVQPYSDEEVLALVVSTNVLKNIQRNWPTATGQIFFTEAYLLVKQRGLGTHYLPTLKSPSMRFPFDTGVPFYSDPSRWRFVLYAVGTQIKFTENLGYTCPFNLQVNKSDLLILGSELKTYVEVKDHQWDSLNPIAHENDQFASDTIVSKEDCLKDDGYNIKPVTSLDVNALGGGVADTDIGLMSKENLGQKKTRDDPFREEMKGAIEALLKEGKDITPKTVMSYLISRAGEKGCTITRVSDEINIKSVFWRNSEGKEEVANISTLKSRLTYLRKNNPELFSIDFYK